MFTKMGKKIVAALCLLFSLETAFAFSDASVLMNFFMSRTDYNDVNNVLHREKISPSMNLDFSNYNLLFLKEHVGFFEHINLHFSDDFFMECLIGPAIGVPLSPRLSIQGGLAFHFIVGCSDDDVNTVASWGRSFKRAVNFQMGLSNDIQLKIKIVKFFNVVAGFYFSIDFLRVENIKLEEGWSTLRTKDFKSFSLSPYFGACFSF